MTGEPRSPARRLTGRLLIDSAALPSGRRATVYVRLLEAGEQDAPATRVGQVVLRDVDLAALRGGSVEFQIDAPPLEPRGTYVVRALADMDGDGETGKGDYCSTVSYPVLTRGHPADVTVRMKYVE